MSVKLLEAPADRRDDPRAMTYIVDHLAPGTTIRRRFEVANGSRNTRTFEIYPAAATIEEQEFRFASGQTSNELASWIAVDQTRLTLEPGGKRSVTATIAVPADASAGERYAVVWASTSSEPAATNSITQISRVGVRVYLDVGPGGEPAADFSIGPLTASRSDSGHPTLSAEVHNTGGRALDLVGDLTLTDGPGRTTAGPYEAVRGTTLAPGMTGSVRVTPPADLANGPWTATLRLSSGRVQHEATAKITFPAPGAAPNRFEALFAGNRRTWFAVIVGVVAVLVLLALAVVRRARKVVTG